MPREVAVTRFDRAVHFYIDRYVLGYPDEAKEGRGLQGASWLHSPAMREAMAAIGLVSMANLRDEKSLLVLARERYGAALSLVAADMARSHEASLEMPIRAVVMLAMYEVREKGKGEAWRRGAS